MSQVFQGTNWTLYEGDSLEIMRQLPPGKFDAIITDPPYSSGGLSMSSRQQDPVSKYVQHGTQRKDITFHGDQRDQRSWSYWLTMCLILAADQLRTGGRLYMFSDWRQLPTATDVVQAAGLLWRGIIAWDKGRGSRAPHTGYHRHQCEYIVWATKGQCERADGRGPFDGCIKAVVPSTKLHPTQKPIELMAELVRATPEGSRILDPFAGSGTTMLAAIQNGRQCVGIEKEPAYCRIIADRMNKGVEQSNANQTTAPV